MLHVCLQKFNVTGIETKESLYVMLYAAANSCYDSLYPCYRDDLFRGNGVPISSEFRFFSFPYLFIKNEALFLLSPTHFYVLRWAFIQTA